MDFTEDENALRLLLDDNKGQLGAVVDTEDAGRGKDVFGVLSDDTEGPADVSPPPEEPPEQAAMATQAEQPKAAPPVRMEQPPVRQRAAPPPTAPTGKPGQPLDWAELDKQLRQARQAEASTRSFAPIFANAGEIGAYRPTEGMRPGAQSAMALQPLEMAKQRQDFEGKSLAQEVQQSNLKGAAAAKDPNSMQSQKAREAFKSFFGDFPLPAGFDEWSAADIERFTKGGGLEMAKQHHADKRADAAARVKAEEQAKREAEAAKRRGEDLEWRKQVHEDNLAHTKALEAAALRKEGQLPAGEATKLGGSDAALKALDDLSTDWDTKASGVGSSVKQFIPGTDANLYGPGLKATTQVVGTFLEGGKLTDADVPKYEAMMPTARDTQAQKEAKIAHLRKLISDKRASEGAALRGSGYKVPPSRPPFAARVQQLKAAGKSKDEARSILRDEGYAEAQ